jgi:ribosomal protein S18 acetylase RimI-like enzyme
VSVTVDIREVGPGSDDYVEQAWDLKESIRQAEGVLKQRKGFFTDAYRRSRVHVAIQLAGDEERPVGFVATRRDGYVLFLAVDSEYRGQGLGERLIARVVGNHSTVTCHARTMNENALRFYEHLGFEVKRRIDSYYEDGGHAYYLKLGDNGGIAERLSEFVRR